MRTFSPVASSSRAGALGERLHADRGEQVVGGAQLRARVDAAILAAQPLAVEQVRAGELGTQPRAAEPLDRLAIEPLGGLALAQQRARARRDARAPSRSAATAVAATMRSSARARAAPARSLLVAASSSSLAAQTETNSSGVSSLASCAAASASS